MRKNKRYLAGGAGRAPCSKEHGGWGGWGAFAVAQVPRLHVMTARNQAGGGRDKPEGSAGETAMGAT